MSAHDPLGLAHLRQRASAPGSVTYFYDGREVGQITTGITNTPMYLILNQGIGVGDLAGTEALPVPNELVDYVRGLPLTTGRP